MLKLEWAIFFCKELEKEIKLQVDDKELYLPEVFQYLERGFMIKEKPDFTENKDGDWKLVHDKKENDSLIIWKIEDPEFLENKKIQVGDRVLEIDGKPAKEIEDDPFA